nr:unnamed protein product [Callosobruchus chinensis]
MCMYPDDYLCAKLSSQIFALRQLKSCVDNSTLITVYYSLIHNSSLTWASHVDYLCAKLSSQIFALRHLKSCVDNSTLRTVYYSLIHKRYETKIELNEQTHGLPSRIKFRDKDKR